MKQTAVKKNKEKETTAVTAPAKALSKGKPVDLNAWGVNEQKLTGRDIMIPKILAMQAMSKPVVNGVAKFGEFRDSLNNTVMGTIETPMLFIPFYMEKVYVVMVGRDKTNNSFKFERTVPITPENEGQEFETEDKEGIKTKWYRTQNIYVLLPDQVEKGCAIPYLLCFRSSSARAGQKIATTMYMKNLKSGGTPASMCLELSGTKTQNDKGTFVVMDVKEKRESTEREIQEAFDWVKLIRSGAVRVDHSDLEADSAPVQEAPESTEF